MKKVLSTLVAALVAVSFSAVVFAADAPKTEPVKADAAAPAVEKKEVKKVKKVKKAKKTVKKEVKKEEAAAPAAAPAK